MKCPFLENHVCIRADGQYRLCCISMESSNTETIYTHSPSMWLNSKPVTQAKDQLSKGEWPKACLKCKRKEDQGLTSKRLSWTPTSKEIEYLDLRFGNQCNLRCHMCFPGSSSSLWYEHEDLKQKGIDSPWGNVTFPIGNWITDEYIDKILNDTNPSEVYLTGGEPFMVKGLPDFLDKLPKNIHIRFNTNATILNKKLIQKLKQFETISITASIDGIGKVNDYIRWGSDWNIITSNLTEFEKFAHVNISPTLQVMNSLHYPAIKDWATRSNYTMYSNFLFHPNYLNISSLPIIGQKMLHQDLQEQVGNPSQEEINKFIKYTKVLDEYRGTNINDYIPDIGRIYGIN